MEISSIIGAIVIGLIIGVLGRLVVPGRQRIGVLWTILVDRRGLHRVGRAPRSAWPTPRASTGSNGSSRSAWRRWASRHWTGHGRTADVTLTRRRGRVAGEDRGERDLRASPARPAATDSSHPCGSALRPILRALTGSAADHRCVSSSPASSGDRGPPAGAGTDACAHSARRRGSRPSPDVPTRSTADAPDGRSRSQPDKALGPAVSGHAHGRRRRPPRSPGHRTARCGGGRTS